MATIRLLLLIALWFVVSSSDCLAQTCASPLAFNSPLSGPTVSANSCGGAGANSLDPICGMSSPAPDVIYQFSLNSSRTATSISLTPSFAYDAALVLLSGSCGSGTSCADYVDTASAGGTEVLSLTAVANGTYFLVVTGTTGSATCGPYTLTAIGSLPVRLQSFSVE